MSAVHNNPTENLLLYPFTSTFTYPTSCAQFLPYFRLGDCYSVEWTANTIEGPLGEGEEYVTRICVKTEADEDSSRDTTDTMNRIQSCFGFLKQRGQ